jgi:hypothetical protein
MDVDRLEAQYDDYPSHTFLSGCRGHPVAFQRDALEGCAKDLPKPIGKKGTR